MGERSFNSYAKHYRKHKSKMRAEEEIRRFYKDYVLRFAKSKLTGKEVAAQQYFGAAVACGRILGKDMKRIKKDFGIAEDHYRREGLD